VAHLSQAQPDQAFGPKQNAFVYRIPGKSQDIGTQMAFTMQDDDDNDDNDEDLHSFCILSFLDMNKLWGTADWASQIMKGHEFTIFAYLEAVVVFSPEDTWNQHPVVDYGNAIAKVHVSASPCGSTPCFITVNDVTQVNSTGIYMDAGIIACEFKDDMAQFWLQAVEDQSCDLSWAEGMQPLSGLVIQKYVLS
jgi:hypothetical protein